MKNDFDETLLIGYIHGSLSADENAQVEQQLKADADYRARLATLRHVKRVLKRGISAEIQAQAPPPTMTFDAIAHQVRRKRPRQSWGTHWLSNLTAIAAVFVLMSALLFSLGDRSNNSDPSFQEGQGTVITMTPTLAVLIEVTSTPQLNNAKSTLPTRTPSAEEAEESLEEGVNSIPTRTPDP